jgi:hypothetical protein
LGGFSFWGFRYHNPTAKEDRKWRKEDFLFIEASLYLMADSPGPFPVDMEVGWLEGRFEDGGVYVRFVESMPGFPLKPRKLGAIPETVARSLEPPIGDDVPLPTVQLKGRASF